MPFPVIAVNSNLTNSYVFIKFIATEERIPQNGVCRHVKTGGIVLEIPELNKYVWIVR